MALPAAHPGPVVPRCLVEGVGFAFACAMVVWSAVLVKQGHKGPALMALEGTRVAKAPAGVEPRTGIAPGVDRGGEHTSLDNVVLDDAGTTPAFESGATPQTTPDGARGVRWFNGRPVVPSRVIWMTVTAYTPGAESCWPSDDGMTATLHSVTTNAGRLVAADTSVLPFGSLVSVDGYDAGGVVPVLDRGGKIRGMRLDLLMESVTEARAWGVQRVPVIVWEYADGLPPPNPREVR